MKETYFTRLCSLVEDDDEEIKELFQTYQVQRKPVYNTRKLQEFTIMARHEYSYQQAQVNIKALVNQMSACKNSLEIFSMLKENLTPMGIGRLMNVLQKKSVDPKVDVVDEMLSLEDCYDLLFKGRPYFEVKVNDNGILQNGIKGKYRIELFDPISKKIFKEIEFESKESKALYLWFLLYPRQELAKGTIKKRKGSILDVYDFLYPGDFHLYDKVYSDGKNGRDGFDTFFMQAKSTANRDIERAIGDYDDADWYKINFDRDYYAISLLECNITLDDMFILYKNDHPLNIPQKNRGV